MDFAKVFCTVLCFSSALLSPSSVEGARRRRAIAGPPENLAAVVGRPSTMSCATDRIGTSMNWFVNYIGAPWPTTVVQGCQLNPALVDSYKLITVDQSMPCNLMISSAKRQLAGQYTCQEASGFDQPASAQFVVLDSDPVCYVNNNLDDIAEGDVVKITCDVAYTNNLSPVHVSWRKQGEGSEQPLNATEEIGDGRTRSYVEMVAQAPSISPVRAFAYFAVPVNPRTAATNAPSYTYEWTTNEIEILYCPYNISIFLTPEPTVGNVIICSANGNPDPTYTWFNILTGQVTTGPELTIDAVGAFYYQCRATNTIRGRTCWVDETVNGTAKDARIHPPNTAVVSGDNTTLVCKITSNPLNWVFTPIGLPGITIVSQCVVVSQAIKYYDVVHNNGFCDLVILDSQHRRAGTYTCQEIEQDIWPSTAEVIVFESDPVCTMNVTGDYVTSGERVKLTCSVEYTGRITPVMSWTTSAHEPVTNATNVTTSSRIEYSISMPVYPSTFQAFTSRTYFNAPNIPPRPFTEPARNAPSYEHVWTSRQLTVMSCPYNVKIDPSVSPSGYYFVGQILTCSSDGFPVPTYRWTNLATNETSVGPTYTLTTMGRAVYKCVAANTINDKTCYSSASVTANVISFTFPLNTAVLLGQSVRLSCRFSSQRLSWLFTVSGTTSPISIASNCQVVLSQSEKYSVDMSNASCDLIIPEVHLEQAGTYTCQDPSTLDKPKSALLIVLETDPEGDMKMADDECLMRVSCSVGYRGVLAPSMSWTDSAGNPVNDATESVTTDKVTSYVDVAVKPGTDVDPYTCLTYFNQPDPSSSSQVDLATNRPTYTYQWSSPTVMINETEQCPILVQKNDKSGSESGFFNRTWQAFRNGFSDGDSRYWIGLDRLHDLTLRNNCTLRLDLQEVNGNWFWAEYGHFFVSDAENWFTLSIGNYRGDAGDLMAYHNGARFATYDFDVNGCAYQYDGGFWYNHCFDAGINTSPSYNFYWNRVSSIDHAYLNQTQVWLFC